MDPRAPDPSVSGLLPSLGGLDEGQGGDAPEHHGAHGHRPDRHRRRRRPMVVVGVVVLGVPLRTALGGPRGLRVVGGGRTLRRPPLRRRLLQRLGGALPVVEPLPPHGSTGTPYGGSKYGTAAAGQPDCAGPGIVTPV